MSINEKIAIKGGYILMKSRKRKLNQRKNLLKRRKKKLKQRFAKLKWSIKNATTL